MIRLVGTEEREAWRKYANSAMGVLLSCAVSTAEGSVEVDCPSLAKAAALLADAMMTEEKSRGAS